MPDEKTAEAFAELFGLEEDYRGYVPEYHSLCIFTKRKGGSAVEFVIPDGGNLSDYNKGKGGIHHIALLVDDIKPLKKNSIKKGFKCWRRYL